MESLTILLLIERNMRRDYNLPNVRQLCAEYEAFVPDSAKKENLGFISPVQSVLAFPDGSFELQEAINRANELNIAVRFFHKTLYTRKELEVVPFFEVRCSAPMEYEGTKPVDYGTIYTHGCPICGRGNLPQEDILVDRKFFKKGHFLSLAPDYAVSETVRALIEQNAFTGVQFIHKICDYKGREMRPLWALTVNHMLPPLGDNVMREYGRQFKCGHQILYIRSELQYPKEIINSLSDFNFTQEYIGNFQEQQLVISARVRKVFLENKIRMRYEPVSFV